MGQPAQAVEVIWRPQAGPQTALLECPIFDVLYGGARGGGKTDGMLGDFAQHAQRYGAAAKGVFFRREFKQLEQVVARSRAIYAPLGAYYRSQVATWYFPGGATLRFRHLWDATAASAYQGHDYTWLCFEELTNWPDPTPVDMLSATLRSASGATVYRRATANPGGPGHQWVKARYVDPAPLGYQVLVDPETELHRVYIPARVSDNPALIENDPTYVSRVRASGSAALVKAWLEGDWSIVVGAYFTEFSSDRHVIRPIALPAEWTRFRAMDWGSARPFAVHWFAVSDGTLPGIAKGALVLYREWYGAAGPNVGLKMTAEQVAAGVLSREMGDLPPDRRMLGVADPAMFAEDGGPSIAERQARTGCLWRPADNKRLPGWDQVRSRLVGDDDGPQLLVFSTAVDLIRTLPALQHDEDRLEDLDSEGEDHAADALRYGCMSRPYVRPVPVAAKPRWGLDLSFNELRDRAAKKRRAMED